MSLSREGLNGKAANVIKNVPGRTEIKIVDFKNFLEEMEVENRHTPAGAVRTTDSAGDDASSRSEDGEGYNTGAREANIAYEDGFEAGKAEASRLLQVEYDKKIDTLTGDFSAMVQELSSEIGKYTREYERAIVTLALAVARRIVAREIELDENAVLARAKEAIRKIIGVEKVKIHVNPTDEEYIRQHRTDLNNYSDSVKEIVIEADHKVERGGCIIESELGNIDARISTQFELIQEAFMEMAKQ